MQAIIATRPGRLMGILGVNTSAWSVAAGLDPMSELQPPRRFVYITALEGRGHD
jgi:hypothetical protein